jgi:hypothetical protein
MKNAPTIWVGGKLRSDIFVVPRAGKFISSVGAASSGPFSEDVAPGRGLEFLWGGASSKMSALAQPQYRLGQAKSGQVRLGQVGKINFFYGHAACLFFACRLSHDRRRGWDASPSRDTIRVISTYYNLLQAITTPSPRAQIRNPYDRSFRPFCPKLRAARINPNQLSLGKKTNQKQTDANQKMKSPVDSGCERITRGQTILNTCYCLS